MAYSNITDPSAYFQTVLYTGNAGTLAITNDGNSDLQPDWIWLKSRGVASHNIYDSSRGQGKHLAPDITYQEITYHGVTAFNSDGFTLSSGGDMNYNGASFVAWQWKANGGTTSTNTDGTITSTVQANTDAGFNIVTYTGNGANSNFGHGMGEQPDMVIVKNRTSAANWCVWHKDLTSSYYLQLDTTISQQSGPWDGLDPSSNRVFIYSGGLVNASGSNYVAYIFKSKQGYSKFGKYTGNGSTNGTFVYTGFKPAFVMTKKRDQVSNWTMYDNKRDPFNVADKVLLPNANNADQTVINFDFVSNGFKCRNSGSENESGTTFIYMAFAENPFVAGGIPTTAR